MSSLLYSETVMLVYFAFIFSVMSYGIFLLQNSVENYTLLASGISNDLYLWFLM